jgi:hypothetical protein
MVVARRTRNNCGPMRNRSTIRKSHCLGRSIAARTAAWICFTIRAAPTRGIVRLPGRKSMSGKGWSCRETGERGWENVRIPLSILLFVPRVLQVAGARWDPVGV